MRSPLVLIALVGCSSKSSSLPPQPPQGSGSAAATELRWTGKDGALLGVLHDNQIDGPCGPIATLDGATLVFPDRKVSIAELTFKDGTLVFPGLVFELHVSPAGEVTQHVTSGGKPDEPAGKVTGLVDEAARDRFRGLAAAIAMNELPAVVLRSVDSPPVAMYRFDHSRILDGRGNPVWFEDQPPIDAEHMLAGDVTVTRTAHGFDVAIVDPTQDVRSGGTGYRATSFAVAEKPDGTLAFGDTPFATLEHRLACPAHDKQVAALLRVMFWRDDGALSYLRGHGLTEPPLPPPPPPPKRR